jgi:hypothetical protein
MPALKASSHWKRLRKKAKKGRPSDLVATIAFYGPDDRRASKVAVGIASISATEEIEMAPLQRWFSESGDVRTDERIGADIVEFLSLHHVSRVAMVDRIIGCPHEEGIDYEGATCPMCPFWANRDRWTGKLLNEGEQHE